MDPDLATRPSSCFAPQRALSDRLYHDIIQSEIEGGVYLNNPPADATARRLEGGDPLIDGFLKNTDSGPPLGGTSESRRSRHRADRESPAPQTAPAFPWRVKAGFEVITDPIEMFELREMEDSIGHVTAIQTAV